MPNRMLDSEFWRIGTSSNKYFLNYYEKINYLEIFSKITLNNEHYLYLEDGKILNFNSVATIKQNLVSWEAFGFIKKIDDNKYIKMIDSESIDFLYDHSKYSLLLPSNDKQVKRYRTTIIFLLLTELNFDFTKNEKLKTIKSKRVNFEVMKKIVSSYETKVLNDEEYKKIIESIGYFYDNKQDFDK